MCWLAHFFSFLFGGKIKFVKFLLSQGLRICPSQNRYYHNDKQLIEKMLTHTKKVLKLDGKEKKPVVDHSVFKTYLRTTWAVLCEEAKGETEYGNWQQGPHPKKYSKEIW